MPCGPICGSGIDFNTFAGLGLNVSAFSTSVNLSANVDSVFHAAAGGLYSIPANGMSTYKGFAFDAATSNTAVQLANFSLLNAQSVVAEANAAFTLAMGSRCNVDLVNVTANAKLSYSCAKNSSLDFSSLVLRGTLSVVGGGNVKFPTTAAGVTGGGGVSLSGGPTLSGFSGSATLNLISSSSGEAFAMIAENTNFVCSGNVTGNNSRFTVSGTFSFDAQSVAAAMNIGKTGTFSIKGKSMKCGALSVSGGGKVDLSATADGDATVFDSVPACEANATIIKRLGATFAASASSGTVFAYTKAGFTTPPPCSVTLVDSTNAVLVLQTAGGVSAQDHSHVYARFPNARILASSAGTATWSDSKLTYSTGAGAAIAPVFALVVVSIFMALF